MSWEGNRRSGVALAMRYRIQWFVYLRARGLSNWEDEQSLRLTAHFALDPYTARPVPDSTRQNCRGWSLVASAL